MKHLDECIKQILNEKTAHNIAVRAGIGDKILADRYQSTERVLTESTLFDMASVTKIAVTTMLLLIAMDKKLISPEDRVSRFFACPDDKRELTIEHLITHRIGYGNFRVCENGGKDEAVRNILNHQGELKCGENVIYSCPAFILLGKIIEKVFNAPLNELFLKYVAKPLNMHDSGYLPKGGAIVNSNLSPAECGRVNDFNCVDLGGVSGNAGLFSNMCDMTQYAKMLIKHGAPIISGEAFEIAVKNHTKGMNESRGLGFVYVDKSFSQCGDLFKDGSIGHCGHTGQSVFVDLSTGLYVIILSDATISTVKKYQHEDYDEVIMMREKIHRAIHEDLEK